MPHPVLLLLLLAPKIPILSGLMRTETDVLALSPLVCTVESDETGRIGRQLPCAIVAVLRCLVQLM